MYWNPSVLTPKLGNIFFSDDFCLSTKKLARPGCCRQIGKLLMEFSNPEGAGP